MRTMLVAMAAVGYFAIGSGLFAQDVATSAPPELARARAAASALTTELKARLMKEMASGGAVAAVRVCSEVAQQIAKEHSTEGVVVRRVSTRWRNPADKPDTWEAKQLQRLAVSHAGGAMPEEVFEGVGTGGWRVFRYARPIVIGGPCLSCHGDPAAMNPEVVALLHERYPDDRATGYREGDLRGIVSVAVPLGAR